MILRFNTPIDDKMKIDRKINTYKNSFDLSAYRLFEGVERVCCDLIMFFSMRVMLFLQGPGKI